MVSIPEEYTKGVKTIIEWHLDAYTPDVMFNPRLERILEHFFERNLVDGIVQVEENELYYINECVSAAANYVNECGVEKDLVWEIYDWVVAERKKAEQ